MIEQMGAAIDSLHGQRYGRFYLYPGTRTLENRKNIRDAKDLQNFESSRFCGGILKRMFTSGADGQSKGKCCALKNLAAFGEFFPRDYTGFGVRQ